MQLLPEELRKQIPVLYSQENNIDPIVVCKFFDPVGSWTWYVLEGEEKDSDFLLFGYVVGQDCELGYFSLQELESAKKGCTGLQALPIERDLYFIPCRLSEIKKIHGIE